MNHTATPLDTGTPGCELQSVDLKQQLERVITDVWGHLTDQQPDLREEPAPLVCPDAQLYAAVDITGDLRARIEVLSDSRFVTHVARHWLGDPTLDVEDSLLDTIGELANLFGGNLKTKLGNLGASLKISLPASKQVPDSNPAELLSPESICFGACSRNGTLIVALTTLR